SHAPRRSPEGCGKALPCACARALPSTRPTWPDQPCRQQSVPRDSAWSSPPPNAPRACPHRYPFRRPTAPSSAAMACPPYCRHADSLEPRGLLADRPPRTVDGMPRPPAREAEQPPPASGRQSRAHPHGLPRTAARSARARPRSFRSRSPPRGSRGGFKARLTHESLLRIGDRSPTDFRKRRRSHTHRALSAGIEAEGGEGSAGTFIGLCHVGLIELGNEREAIAIRTHPVCECC